MFGRGPRPPQLKFNDFFQSAFSVANIFQKYFVCKNWRGGGEFMGVGKGGQGRAMAPPGFLFTLFQTSKFQKFFHF